MKEFSDTFVKYVESMDQEKVEKFEKVEEE